MRARAERLAENALRELKQTLDRNITDIGAVMDMYELTHDEGELAESKEYQALVAVWFALQRASKAITKTSKTKKDEKED